MGLEVPPKVNEDLKAKIVRAALLKKYQTEELFVLKTAQFQGMGPCVSPLFSKLLTWRRLAVSRSNVVLWSIPPPGILRSLPLHLIPPPPSPSLCDMNQSCWTCVTR